MSFVLAVFLVALLAFSVYWLIERPTDQLQAGKNPVQEKWEKIKASVFPEQEDFAAPLKAWAQASLADEPALQEWLLSLPKEALQALGEKVSEFCREMNVELGWVIHPGSDVAPQSKTNAESIVIDYCKICLKAVENKS